MARKLYYLIPRKDVLVALRWELSQIDKKGMRRPPDERESKRKIKNKVEL